MKKNRKLLILLALVALPFVLWYGVLTSSDSRSTGRAALRMHSLIQPADPANAKTLAADITVTPSRGLPDEISGQLIHIDYQFPDRLRLSTTIDDKKYRIGRLADEIWLHAPENGLAVVGANDVARFAGDADSLDPIELPEFHLPIKRWQLRLLPAFIESDSKQFSFKSWARKWFDLPKGQFGLAATEQGMPSQIQVTTEDLIFDIEFSNQDAAAPHPDTFWQIPVPEDEAELVAVSHLTRFAEVAISNLDAKIPTLGPATGSRKVLATHGNGRLEDIDGTRVLFLKGTPEEMGAQHGTLMRDEVRNLVDRIVYGVGVGSSLDKGRWFFGEIEEAQGRLEPFISERHIREMDSLAAAAGLHPQETRLSNFFPELFHCSGFALHGSATADGQMYHGRVLDYLRGLGLEQNATVMIVQPDQGNAWVNLGYAGFVGSVTAMNEKHLAIGEMGGRGEGNWDGTPMAQLMRDVMEGADTIDEAIEIMRNAKRTCEYYYVISDAKDGGRAVGIKATPELFETVWSGQSHPQLADPVEDTVLMSAGDRYKELVRRVKGDHGKFDADSARELMSRPVCMNSNIQSVLFAPGTLDFWVANADSENVASHTRYTHYNLAELLNEKPQFTDAR
jgi:hypothetical protein